MSTYYHKLLLGSHSPHGFMVGCCFGTSQPASRMFWSLVSLNGGMTVIGVNASNTFAEADLPEDLMYMYIDNQYQHWWTVHPKKPPIPKGCVLPVQHAIQGHPWPPNKPLSMGDPYQQKTSMKLTLIALFMRDVCIKPRSITPRSSSCDKWIFFAVVSKDSTIAKQIIAKIGSKLQVSLNHLGIIAKFNGIDVIQSKATIKVFCQTYLDEVLNSHK